MSQVYNTTRLVLAGAAAAALSEAPRYFPSLKPLHSVATVTTVFLGIIEMDIAKHVKVHRHLRSMFTCLKDVHPNLDHIANHIAAGSILLIANYAARCFGTYYVSYPMVIAVSAGNVLIDMLMSSFRTVPGTSAKMIVEEKREAQL